MKTKPKIIFRTAAVLSTFYFLLSTSVLAADVIGHFPTLIESDGARTQDAGTVWLGESSDKESNSRQVDKDNDDGVVADFASCAKSPVTFLVHVKNPGKTTGIAYLNLFADWNRDGRWSGSDSCASEWTLKNYPIDLSAQESIIQPYTLFVSAGKAAKDTWYRTVISLDEKMTREDGGGELSAGEVEDYGPITMAQIIAEMVRNGRQPPPVPSGAACKPISINHRSSGIISVEAVPGSDPIAETTLIPGGVPAKFGTAKKINNSLLPNTFLFTPHTDPPHRLDVFTVPIKVRYNYGGTETLRCSVWVLHDELPEPIIVVPIEKIGLDLQSVPAVPPVPPTPSHETKVSVSEIPDQFSPVPDTQSLNVFQKFIAWFEPRTPSDGELMATEIEPTCGFNYAPGEDSVPHGATTEVSVTLFDNNTENEFTVRGKKPGVKGSVDPVILGVDKKSGKSFPVDADYYSSGPTFVVTVGTNPNHDRSPIIEARELTFKLKYNQGIGDPGTSVEKTVKCTLNIKHSSSKTPTPTHASRQSGIDDSQKTITPPPAGDTQTLNVFQRIISWVASRLVGEGPEVIEIGDKDAGKNKSYAERWKDEGLGADHWDVFSWQLDRNPKEKAEVLAAKARAKLEAEEITVSCKPLSTTSTVPHGTEQTLVIDINDSNAKNDFGLLGGVQLVGTDRAGKKFVLKRPDNYSPVLEDSIDSYFVKVGTNPKHAIKAPAIESIAFPYTVKFMQGVKGKNAVKAERETSCVLNIQHDILPEEPTTPTGGKPGDDKSGGQKIILPLPAGDTQTLNGFQRIMVWLQDLGIGIGGRTQQPGEDIGTGVGGGAQQPTPPVPTPPSGAGDDVQKNIASRVNDFFVGLQTAAGDQIQNLYRVGVGARDVLSGYITGQPGGEAPKQFDINVVGFYTPPVYTRTIVLPAPQNILTLPLPSFDGVGGAINPLNYLSKRLNDLSQSLQNLISKPSTPSVATDNPRCYVAMLSDANQQNIYKAEAACGGYSNCSLSIRDLSQNGNLISSKVDNSFSGESVFTASIPNSAAISVVDITCDALNYTAIAHNYHTGAAFAPQPFSVTTSSLAAASVNIAYSQTMSATGGIGQYAWSVSSGALPTGLSIAASTGVISGTPTAANTFNFTIQASDADGRTATRAYSVVAYAELTITTTTLAEGTNGTAYSETVVAAGGSGSNTFTVSAGSLPTGLTLAASTGIISGTPTVTNTFNFTITVTDSLGATDGQALEIVVNAAADPLDITTASPLVGASGVPYSGLIAATGGTAPYSWTVTQRDGNCTAANCRININSGLLEDDGMVGTQGTVQITVTDADLNTDVAVFQILHF